jgi:hypothetical protein
MAAFYRFKINNRSSAELRRLENIICGGARVIFHLLSSNYSESLSLVINFCD